ncbi:CheR family methyltransferase [Flavobacterium sp.]|uniref:CheR family methyltransferase n=1 Tax=Flavobacterium sp. TaxID=239 RepID=UPI0031DE6719
MDNFTEKIFDIRKHSLPVVGVAASIDSLTDVETLLKHLPEKSGMSFILYIVNEQSGNELINKLCQSTTLQTKIMESGSYLDADTIYLLKSDQTLSHKNGTLTLAARRRGNDSLSEVDHFFVSLALACKEFARGILIFDNITDGLTGLGYIREQGGTAFVHLSEIISADSGNYSTSITEAADFVLNIQDIPAQLQLLESVYDANYSFSYEKGMHILQGDNETYTAILHLLHQKSGNDFSNYRQPTIRRRIARRMVIAKIKTSTDYLVFLKNTPHELDLLFRDLLIPVTDFFRDAQVFKMLPEIVYPRIINRKTNQEPIRIWVAGCSTGEEAYSIAMSLHEFLTEKQISLKVQIFASDISENSIAKARAGVYSRRDVRRVSEQRISRYFTKIENSYHINKEIRDLCIFASHNFIKDPPFAKLDLVSCRNVLIYLDSNLQKKAFKTFHYGLVPEGMLLLGKSESTNYTPGLFEPLVKNLKIFNRLNGIHSKIPISRERFDIVSTAKSKIVKKEFSQPDFQKAAQNFLFDHYTPAGVIVNEKKEIIHFHGDTGPFLLSPQGKPNYNILEMVREGLAFEVRSALLEARKMQQKSTKASIPLKGRNYLADIEVVPLHDGAEEKHYLIVFRKSAKIIGEQSDYEGVKGRAEKRIKTLEKEIEQLREDIKKVTEDQELANEELQSANEELLSTSEELQTLNEELETSAEQLQSNNEELLAMNEELIDRQQQLVFSRLYAEAIIENIREPLVIIDGGLRVKSANASFYTHFSATEESVEGKIIFDTLIGTGNLSDHREQIELSVSKNSKMDNTEVRIIMPSGEEKIMIMNVRPISNIKLGEPLALLAFEDITDLLTTNKILASTNYDLADKNKQLASFTSVASHDLQEPLRKISIFTGMILKNPNNVLSEETLLHIKRILVSAGRMQQLIDDLLMYSKVSKVNEEDFIETDLAEVIGEACDEIDDLIAKKNAVIHLGNFPIIKIIPALIRQVFINLISNSLKYSKEDQVPVITISAASDYDAEKISAPGSSNSYLQISVQDNGIGFPQTAKLRLFDPFFRLHSKEEYEGTGIGLALCKKIMELHAGYITCEGEPDKGSTFYLYFPIFAQNTKTN